MMIQARALTLERNDRRTVNGVSFEIERGECVGLLGPFGAGKSSLLKMLGTLLRPTDGAARVMGYDLLKQPRQIRAKVGYLDTPSGGYGEMLLTEYLEFFARLQGTSSHDREPAIDRALGLAGLSNRRHDHIETLDRAQFQQLALVRCTLHAPSVLLLDEPAQGLAPLAREQIKRLIADLRQPQRTVLLTSNILSDLTGLCRRLLVMSNGRLIESGPTDSMADKLAPMRPIELHLRGDPDRAVRTARTHPAVVHVEWIGDSLVILSDRGRQPPAGLVAELVELGVPVERFREHEVDPGPLVAEQQGGPKATPPDPEASG